MGMIALSSSLFQGLPDREENECLPNALGFFFTLVIL